MRRVPRECVREYYVERETRSKSVRPRPTDHNIMVVDAYRCWHQVELARDLFMRLVVVAAPGSRPLLPVREPRLLQHVAGRAVEVASTYRGPWKMRYILELRAGLAGGDRFPDLLILREKVDGEPAEGSLYLQDGNHRAIAYAMALIADGCEYVPVRAYLGSDLDAASAFGQRHRPAADCGDWRRELSAQSREGSHEPCR